MAGNILLVDDDSSMRHICSLSLKKQGYNIFTASNALIAKDILRKNKIDLIILDIMMPHTDGITFLERLRLAGNDTQVIIITGNKEINISDLDVYDIMYKPFSLRELRTNVTHAINDAIYLNRNRASFMRKIQRAKHTVSKLSALAAIA